MHLICWLLFLTTAYPLWLAWQANRWTSLFNAVHWVLLAWVAWAIVLAVPEGPGVDRGRYLALCLTGCAGVAVLGARRPGVGAWNFVVVALLAVNLLPVVEGWFTGGVLQLGPLRATCVAATIAVGILNYLPTRLFPGVVLFLIGITLEFAVLVFSDQDRLFTGPGLLAARLVLAIAPWTALGGLHRNEPVSSEADRLWFWFRERFGLVWGQRLREQFNSSATHSGWPVILRWQGMRLKPGSPRLDLAEQEAILSTLRALMKRFRDGERST
jgi:hypothetical protein